MNQLSDSAAGESQRVAGQGALGTAPWICGDSIALMGSADPRATWQKTEGIPSWCKVLKCKRVSLKILCWSGQTAARPVKEQNPQKDKERVGNETGLCWEMKGEGAEGP